MTDPLLAFRLVARCPRWVMLLMVSAIVKVTALGLTRDLRIAAMTQHGVPPSMEHHLRSPLAAAGNALFAPVTILAGWLLLAGLLWVLGGSLNLRAPFRSIFAAAAHATLPLAAGSIASAVVLRRRASPAPVDAVDLDVQFGLGALWRSANAFWDAALRATSVFEVWHVLLVGVAAHAILGARPRTAGLIAVVYAGVRIACRATFSIVSSTFAPL